MNLGIKSYIVNLIEEINTFSNIWYEIGYRGKNHTPVLIQDGISIVARGWKNIKDVVEIRYALVVEKMFK